MSLLAQGEDVFAVRKGAARHASAVKKVQAPLHYSLHAEAACTERVQWRVKQCNMRPPLIVCRYYGHASSCREGRKRPCFSFGDDNEKKAIHLCWCRRNPAQHCSSCMQSRLDAA